MRPVLGSGLFGRERRIGRRLTVLVFAFSSGATLLFSALQLGFEQRNLHRALDRELEGIGIYARSLEGSVWDFDERQVQRAIDGLVLLPHVAHVRVTDASTGRTWDAGQEPAAGSLTRVFPLRHQDRGVEREIGKVEVIATLEPIRRQVIASAVTVLVSNALLTVLVALLMVLLIRRLVTARLERLAGRVRALAPSLLPAGPTSEAPPVPPDLDELDAVDWALGRATHDLGAAVGALRGSEARYRRIVETAHEGIWVVDRDGRIAFANRQLAGLLGCTAEELLGTPLLDFVHEEGRPAALALLDRAPGHGGPPAVVRFRRRDGGDRFGLVGTTPLLDERGARAGALGMVADVTEQRRLEDQLRQSQKLEAVGRLAAGVAHDFNNLLTAMLADAQLLAEELPAGSAQRGVAQEIDSAVQRAALLTRQLLAFGRKETARPRVLDLNAVVTSTERMLRRLIGEDVELVTVLAPGLWRVLADPGQVEQVIVNVAVNARDAMPGGGRLTIQTENIERPPRAPAQPGGGARSFVVLSVTDTGTGMSDEVQAHLFEPFFTTKEPGKGTGLGLSTVYGIVKQAGGDVVVASEAGNGTTVRVYLPRTEEPAEVAPAPGRGPPAARGSEVVLVVDDEPLVRSGVTRILGAAGYTVLSATTCDEALALATSAADRQIDLLVTDLVLAGPGGVEVASRLRQVLPGLPVLFVSGYSDRAVDLGGEGGLAAFLAKPFSNQELTAQVRELLDRMEGEERVRA